MQGSKVELKPIDSMVDAEATINDNYIKIQEAFNNTVSRDGTGPNTVNKELNLDLNKLTNVKDGTEAYDAVNYKQLTQEVLDITVSPVALTKENVGVQLWAVTDDEAAAGWGDYDDTGKPVNRRLYNWFKPNDVRRYKVVPDTTQAQTTEIQDALDIQCSATGGYQSLYFPQGEYVVTYLEAGDQEIIADSAIFKLPTNTVGNGFAGANKVAGWTVRSGSTYFVFQNLRFDLNEQNQNISSTASADDNHVAALYLGDEIDGGGTKDFSSLERVVVKGSLYVKNILGHGIVHNDGVPTTIGDLFVSGGQGRLADSKYVSYEGSYTDELQIATSNQNTLRAPSPRDLGNILTGLTPVYVSSTLVGVAPGTCVATGGNAFMRLEGARSDITPLAAWSESTGGFVGPLPGADAWYALFIISNEDGSKVSFATTEDENGSAVLDPLNLPHQEGFRYKRRIGWLRTVGGSIQSFSQTGRRTIWTDPLTEISGQSFTAQSYATYESKTVDGVPPSCLGQFAVRVNGNPSANNGPSGDVFNLQIAETTVDIDAATKFDNTVFGDTASGTKNFANVEINRRVSSGRVLRWATNSVGGTDSTSITFGMRTIGFVDDRAIK